MRTIKLSAILFTLLMFLAPLATEAKGLDRYLKEAPWLGLISDTVHYGPIEISDVKIHKKSKLAIVHPEETLEGTLHYKIDAEHLSTMRLHHLLIGVKGVGPQDCLTHTFGVFNSDGETNFTLKAPKARGIYQVRFMLAKGITCSEARDTWTTGKKSPSSSATIGVIIVE